MAARSADGGGSPSLRRPETDIARKLRHEMSLPEVLLWQRLRGGRAGAKVRRQHPIGPYVVDFYCPEARLAIEIDGEAHHRSNRPARDAARDAFLAENGYRVLHIPAAEVMRDVDQVASSIAMMLASHPPRDGEVAARSADGGGSPRGEPLAEIPLHHRPAAGGPPPRAGEDVQ